MKKLIQIKNLIISKNWHKLSIFVLILLTNISFAQTVHSDSFFNIQDNCSSSSTGFNSIVSSIALQNDGKIIVGGVFTQFNDNSANYLIRLNSDGSFDSSFNIGTGFNSRVNSIKIQSDNKVIVGGNFTSYNGTATNYIVRLNQDGTIDNTFTIGNGFNNEVSVIEIQSDSKILVGGKFTNYNSISNNRIIRLNTDGTQDNTFSIGTGFNQAVRTIAIQSNNKIIVGGEFTSYNGTTRNYIVRLNSDGSNDTDFNISNGFNDWVLSIVIQPTGEIIIGGYFSAYAGNTAICIVRLLSNGQKDTSFISTLSYPWIYTLAIQNDGKILAGGNGFMRINSDGTVDNSFTIGTGFNTNPITIILIQPNNKILVGGNFTTYNGTCRRRIARLTHCIPFNAIDNILACNNYTWIDGVTYTSSNNTATHNIVGGAANGCDSLVTLNLTINNISDITTTIIGNTSIKANNTNATYQWLDCNNNYEKINGAINQTYTPTANGSYAVEFSENGCVDTSFCVVITTVGINEKAYFIPKIKIYPNPTTSILTIITPIENTIFIYNTLGVLSKQIHLTNGEHKIDISNFAKGIYILKTGTETIKFIKE